MESKEDKNHHLDKEERLTLKSGAPVGDKFNSLLTYRHGLNLMADVAYLEETAHFNRERIPERVVHAKGIAAYGHFVVTKTDITKYTKAAMFSKVGKATPVVARFSHVTGESGYADTVRDVRGFAVRFQTELGNWDLVGNNLPVFFIRDPINFTSFIHSQKRDPKTHLKNPNAFWDFVACKPETLHTLMMLFSDRGIPDGFRHMHGFGVNTFKLVNEKMEHFFAKFHWVCDQKIRNLTEDKANKLAGVDPDYTLRDFQQNITAGNFPSWTLKVQIIRPDQVGEAKFDIFDVTKTWPHKDYPLIEVGKMVLERNVSNYFAEMEQLAFSPSNLIQGIEASNDKMLVGRMMSYPDAQRYRLGANYQDMPCNQARCPVMTPTYCDGITYTSNHFGQMPNYVPSLKCKGMSLQDEKFVEHKQAIPASHQGRFDLSDQDNYSQVKSLINNVMKEDERNRLIENICNHMSTVTEMGIISVVMQHLRKIDEKFAKSIQDRVAFMMQQMKQQI